MKERTKINLVYVIQLALIFVVGVIVWQILVPLTYSANPTAIDYRSEGESNVSRYVPVVHTQFSDANGVIFATHCGEANIEQLNIGNITKKTIWEDGVELTEIDPRWMGFTFGRAKRPVLVKDQITTKGTAWFHKDVNGVYVTDIYDGNDWVGVKDLEITKDGATVDGEPVRLIKFQYSTDDERNELKEIKCTE